MREGELKYEDFLRRLTIQDILLDAGYHLNKRDGLRYPSYVRLDNDGRRIRGDKFIVTHNGQCCFQPPQQKLYNVISFIKEHPQLFSDYHAGMSTDRLVNLVCNRLLNQPVLDRSLHPMARWNLPKVFNIDDYEIHSFIHDDWESQKKFYPYFKNRGIDLQTQKAFAGHYFLATKERTDGKRYTNLSFPLSLAAWPNRDIVGMEERGRPNADGKAMYKGMANGSNAAEGLWIARLEDHRSDMGFTRPIGANRDVYWFESAFDAMAFYQLELKRNPLAFHDLGNAVFVSTGGNPSRQQFASLLAQTPYAIHHLCFDRDKAGEMYSVNFALQNAGKVFTSNLSQDKSKILINDLTQGMQRYELDIEPFDFSGICDKLGIRRNNISYNPPDAMYKDWNDALLNKRDTNLGRFGGRENDGSPHEEITQHSSFRR